MAGYREFMPGQVWFYYNADATKDLEKKKELGAITSRPVVIVQSAFYPEWNDTVTVCPLTSSDRRSGVYIESTIFKDGSMIEGGTIMPYLLYTIKTKFLYPVIATNRKRKLISLAPEDWEKVRNGYLYHLGEPVPVPDYVENWKHINEFDRAVILRDVHLAISDMDDMASESRAPHFHGNRKSLSNPKLNQQIPKDGSTVENHIIASLTQYDRKHQQLYEDTGCFTTERVMEDPATKTKPVSQEIVINYKSYGMTDFVNLLSETSGELFKGPSDTVHEGSELFKNVPLKDMLDNITPSEALNLLGMTVSEIINHTGINSSSTASRLRRALRDRYTESGDIDVVDNKVGYFQNLAPQPFTHKPDDTYFNKSRLRRTAKRRKYLFGISHERALELIGLPLEQFVKEVGCPLSYAKLIKLDIAEMYPDDAVVFNGEERRLCEITEDVERETVSASRGPSTDKFPLWETFSPGELHEIRSSSKRNLPNIAKSFGISKERMKILKEQLSDKPTSKIPEASGNDRSISCRKVIGSNSLGDVSPYDLLVFCRCETNFILGQYSQVGSSNTPSKANIKRLKNQIRRMIASDLRMVRRI